MNIHSGGALLQGDESVVPLHEVDVIVQSGGAPLQGDQSVVPPHKVDMIVHSGGAPLQGDQSVVPLCEVDMIVRSGSALPLDDVLDGRLESCTSVRPSRGSRQFCPSENTTVLVCFSGVLCHQLVLVNASEQSL